MEQAPIQVNSASAITRSKALNRVTCVCTSSLVSHSLTPYVHVVMCCGTTSDMVLTHGQRPVCRSERDDRAVDTCHG